MPAADINFGRSHAHMRGGDNVYGWQQHLFAAIDTCTPFIMKVGPVRLCNRRAIFNEPSKRQLEAAPTLRMSDFPTRTAAAPICCLTKEEEEEKKKYINSFCCSAGQIFGACGIFGTWRAKWIGISAKWVGTLPVCSPFPCFSSSTRSYPYPRPLSLSLFYSSSAGNIFSLLRDIFPVLFSFLFFT